MLLGHNWLILDFETSDQNVYSCKIDRACLQLWREEKKELSWTVSWRTCVCPTAELRGIISDHSDIPLLAHNAKFELHLLRRLKINFKQPLHDTYMMAKHYRNDLPAFDLKSLAWWFFGDLYEPLTDLRQWLRDHNGAGEDDDEFDMTLPPDKLVDKYCHHDDHMTALLAYLFYPKVKDNYAYHQDIETIPLVQDMEARGILADVPFYQDFVRRGDRRVLYNTKVAKEQLGIAGKDIKPTGNKLREHLQSRGECRKTKTGLIKTDDVVLRDHRGSRAVRAVGRIRNDQKEINTYARNILAVCDDKGFFHPNFMQSAAITRRFRAAKFYGINIIVKGNPQNFPRGEGIRSGIIVPPGYAYVKNDLASIEPRLASHAMSIFLDFDYYCRRYKEDSKFNMYLHVMHEHTEHKDATKKDPIYIAYKHGCLGIQYGVGVKTFHRTMVDNFELSYTLEECGEIYNTIRKKCPEFSALQRAVSLIVDSQGYITDDFGATYYVPEEERYKGVNYYCQGCAGNVLKWWMLEVEKIRDPKDYSFLTLHDEIDFAISLHDGKKKARKRVQSYSNTLSKLDIFNLPIIAEASDLCKNWAECG